MDHTFGRVLTTYGSTTPTSADRGDAPQTLTVGTDSPVQLWNTTLTANRAVTLSTTGAVNGDRFRILRPSGGLFTLDVGTGPLVSLLSQQACDVQYNGSAWVLQGVWSLKEAPGSGTITAASPAGTTSATAVMMGVNSGASIITPNRTGRVVFSAACQMANSTINDGATVDLRTGTGTGPANAAAVTGTLRGLSQTKTSLVAADRGGFAVTVVVTGLTLGQAYWADLSLIAVTGGTATVTGVTISAWEF